MLDTQSRDFQDLPPFGQLVAIMQALRAPDGCPWDREQTHQSLIRFLLEESYETIEAIERDSAEDMCEELGDLLLQIVFHAQMAREAGRFQIDDVCRAIVDKMIRRHPHVFGAGPGLADAGAVRAQWETIKLQDKQKQRRSLMDGIPPHLPALLQAERIQGRAADFGFDWPDLGAALAKLDEEVAELKAAPPAEAEAELGDVLFAAVSLARKLGVDPESALRSTSRRFVERFTRLEQRLGDLREHGPDEMLAVWNEVK